MQQPPNASDLKFPFKAFESIQVSTLGSITIDIVPLSHSVAAWMVFSAFYGAFCPNTIVSSILDLLATSGSSRHLRGCHIIDKI